MYESCFNILCKLAGRDEFQIRWKKFISVSEGMSTVLIETS